MWSLYWVSPSWHVQGKSPPLWTIVLLKELSIANAVSCCKLATDNWGVFLLQLPPLLDPPPLPLSHLGVPQQVTFKVKISNMKGYGTLLAVLLCLGRRRSRSILKLKGSFSHSGSMNCKAFSHNPSFALPCTVVHQNLADGMPCPEIAEGFEWIGSLPEWLAIDCLQHASSVVVVNPWHILLCLSCKGYNQLLKGTVPLVL